MQLSQVRLTLAINCRCMLVMSCDLYGAPERKLKLTWNHEKFFDLYPSGQRVRNQEKSYSDSRIKALDFNAKEEEIGHTKLQSNVESRAESRG